MICLPSCNRMETKTDTTIGSNSAELIGHNVDLLFKILLNLPTISLIKLKLVSKQWMSLISNNEFCLAHTRFLHAKGSLEPCAVFLDVGHSTTSGFKFLPLTYDRVRIPPLDFIDFPDVKILQSCNGLLLCASTHLLPFHDIDFRDVKILQSRNGWLLCDGLMMFNLSYFICNPTTRSFKKLSLRSLEVKDDMLCGVNFAFDPLRSPHYKIISVWKRENKKILPRLEYFIDVYSSETSSWSLSKINFSWNEGMEFDHGVYFDGAIHWYSDIQDSVYFDVENECLIPTRMPDFSLVRYRSFGESGGSLYLATEDRISNFVVYEMVEDHSHWYLKYNVNLSDALPDRLIRCRAAYKLFCLIQSGGRDSMFIVDCDGRGYKFNDCTRKSMHCATPCTLRILEPDPGRYRCCQYLQTLSCI